MVYEIMKCGKRIRISKNRYIYLRRKKKDIEHLEFIGGIRLKDLKKEPDENIKADDRLNAGWAEYPLLPGRKRSGRNLWLYYSKNSGRKGSRLCCHLFEA